MGGKTQRFMGTQPQEAATGQCLGEQAKGAILQRVVEIDQHVAARYQVHFGKDLVGGQVMFGKDGARALTLTTPTNIIILLMSTLNL